MAATLTNIENPYWDEVRDLVGNSCLGGAIDVPPGKSPDRQDYVRRYAWTISDPATVEFLAAHIGERGIDPMAGTGYWAWLLEQAGASVMASDLYPRPRTAFVQVERRDALAAVQAHSDRTLFLSWPPYSDDLGEKVVRAYQGIRIIYVGEEEGGCCGTGAMWNVLANEQLWREVASHKPIRWWGLHDQIIVYDRQTPVT